MEATDRRFATVKIYTTVIEALKEAVAEKKAEAGREISQETGRDRNVGKTES